MNPKNTATTTTTGTTGNTGFTTGEQTQMDPNDPGLQIKKLADEIADLKTDINKTKSIIDAKNTMSIEVLTLFVAVITFVSISSKMIMDADFIKAAPILLILGGILLLFVLIMDYVVKYWSFTPDNSDIKFTPTWLGHFIILLVCSFALIILGAFLWFHQDKGNITFGIPTNKTVQIKISPVPTATPSAMPVNIRPSTY